MSRGWDNNALNAYEARQRPKRSIPAEGCDDESKLHADILDYCNSQWPKWKVLRARMDKKSTLPKGAHDMTIFMGMGKLLCIECKKRTGKVEPDQRDWIFEMERIGHKVHIVRDFITFLNLVDQIDQQTVKEITTNEPNRPRNNPSASQQED